MRTITITKDLYKFEELPADVQDRVIEKNYDWNVDYDWWEFTYDDIKESLEAAGVSKPDIKFSGFWSQGDGASFTSKSSVDLKKLMVFTGADVKYPDLFKGLGVEFDVSCYIKRTSYQSVHEYSAKLTLDLDIFEPEDPDDYDEDYENQTIDAVAELEGYLEDWRYQYCQTIYRKLEQEYNYLTSREAIIETIDANEYEFTAEGELA